MRVQPEHLPYVVRRASAWLVGYATDAAFWVDFGIGSAESRGLPRMRLRQSSDFRLARAASPTHESRTGQGCCSALIHLHQSLVNCRTGIKETGLPIHIPFFSKKGCYYAQFTRSLKWWQALPDSLSVRFRNQAWVANHQHATIGFIANQSPSALLQINDRFR